jgi:hypothetical protein
MIVADRWSHPTRINHDHGSGCRSDAVANVNSTLERREHLCEPVSGIEPLTCRLQDGCSAN